MLNHLSVHVGARYFRHGTEYEINHIGRTRVIVRQVIGGNIKSFSHGDFNFFLTANGIEVLTPSPDAKEIEDKYLDAKDIKVRNFRLGIVNAILQTTVRYSTRKGKEHKVITKIIRQESRKHGQKPRSVSTVSKWVKKFIESNYAPNSLLPTRKLRASKFDNEVELLVEKKIEENLISNRRIVKKYLAEQVMMELEESCDSIVLPSRRTIMRRIDLSDPSKILANMHGPRKGRKLSIAAGRSRLTTRALEYVEADGNHLDLLLVDPETGEVIGRAYLTVFIDVHTRCVLSFHLTHTPFSGLTFLEAFKGALNEENGLPGGKIQRLFVDNGSDYICASAKNICNLTRTEIEVAPPESPNSKPHVERFFRTLNQQLIHQLPGTTFSNPQHKSEYDSEKFASLDIQMVRNAIKQFTLLYNQSHHQGLKGIPIQKWNQEKKRFRHIIYDSKTVNSFAKLTTMRMINKGRVFFEGLHWYSHALRALELKMNQSSCKQKVQIFVDELDLSTVFVRDPFSDVLIQADSTKPNYTSKLSLFEHSHISQNQKEDMAKAEGLSDTEALRLRIQLRDQLTSEASKSSRKLRARLSDGNIAQFRSDKELMNKEIYLADQEQAENYFNDDYEDSFSEYEDMDVSFISTRLSSGTNETEGLD